MKTISPLQPDFLMIPSKASVERVLDVLEDCVGLDLAYAIDKLDFHEDYISNQRTECEFTTGCCIMSSNSNHVKHPFGLLRFAQEEQSRSLFIMNCSNVPAELIKTICLAQGSLKYFEARFR